MRDLTSLWIHCPNEQEVMCETVRHHASEMDVVSANACQMLVLNTVLICALVHSGQNVQVRRVSSAVLANFDTPMIAQRMLLILQDYEHHLGKQAHGEMIMSGYYRANMKTHSLLL